MISLGETCSGNQNKVFFVIDIVFGQKLTRNAKGYLNMLFLNFCKFVDIDPGLVERSRVKKVIMSNLVISLVP